MVIYGFIFITLTTIVSGSVPPTSYHDFDELTAQLHSLASKFPDQAQLYSLTETSVEGRELWVIKITDGVTVRHPLRPMVKFVANMHGNEPVGRELMLSLAEYLLTSQDDERIRGLLNSVEIHIMPTMNPDGFEKALARTRGRGGQCKGVYGRYNTNGIDLNRDFPTWDDLNTDLQTLLASRAPETRAVMRWILENPFVLSLNFHDGAVVVNYPFDDSDQPSGIPSETDDDELFKELATIYASNHKNINITRNLCRMDYFPDGITNGAEWYVVAGGMQDFNYLFSNCFAMTVELSCCKFPRIPSNPRILNPLTKEWNNNLESLLSFLEIVQTNVIQGIVTDINGNPVEGALVMVNGREKAIVTTKNGEYWRLVLPGTYELTAIKDGWVSDTKEITLSDKSVQVDLKLEPTALRSSGNLPNKKAKRGKNLKLQKGGKSKKIKQRG